MTGWLALSAVIGYLLDAAGLGVQAWPSLGLALAVTGVVAIGLPREVVERAPSAELWEGQTDEGELGFSYAAADLVLHAYREGRQRPGEIAGPGIEPEIVERVLDRVRRNAYKRRLPWIPKLTTRTVGHDFHHPRAWKGSS